jgi:hypothetical protein
MSGVIVTNPPKADAEGRRGAARLRRGHRHEAWAAPAARPRSARPAGRSGRGHRRHRAQLARRQPHDPRGRRAVRRGRHPGRHHHLAVHGRPVRRAVRHRAPAPRGARPRHQHRASATPELREMGFPVWSARSARRARSRRPAARSTCRSCIGGQVVRPGDVILADDDGVVVVPRERPARPPRAVRGPRGEGGGHPRRLRRGPARPGPLRAARHPRATRRRVPVVRGVRPKAEPGRDRARALHADARRHLQGRLLPRRGPARRPRRARRPAAARHGQPRPAPDRRPRRRPPAHQQGRRGLRSADPEARRRLPVPASRRRRARGERPSELRQHPRRRRPVRRGARAGAPGDGETSVRIRMVNTGTSRRDLPHARRRVDYTARRRSPACPAPPPRW